MTERESTPSPLGEPRYGVGMQAGYVGFDTDGEESGRSSSPWLLFAVPLFLALCIVLSTVVA